MHYFTRELWNKINDINGDTRRLAEKEWYANSLKYQQHFTMIEKYFSPEFIKEFFIRSGLHDYSILGIHVEHENQRYACVIQLQHGRETRSLKMSGLTAVKIGIDTFQHFMHAKLAWGYSEFDIIPDRNLQLNILCDSLDELHFEFEAIEFF